MGREYFDPSPIYAACDHGKGRPQFLNCLHPELSISDFPVTKEFAKPFRMHGQAVDRVWDANRVHSKQP